MTDRLVLPAPNEGWVTGTQRLKLGPGPALEGWFVLISEEAINQGEEK